MAAIATDPLRNVFPLRLLLLLPPPQLRFSLRLPRGTLKPGAPPPPRCFVGLVVAGGDQYRFLVSFVLRSADRAAADEDPSHTTVRLRLVGCAGR